MNTLVDEAKSLPGELRTDFLRNHCTSVSTGQYFKRFDDHDLQQTEKEISQKLIETSRAEDDFKKVKAEHTGKIKNLKAKLSELLTVAKQNGEWFEGETYLFANQTTGMMEVYDAFGDIIESRRLAPNERQMSIHDRGVAGSISVSKEAVK